MQGSPASFRCETPVVLVVEAKCAFDAKSAAVAKSSLNFIMRKRVDFKIVSVFYENSMYKETL